MRAPRLSIWILCLAAIQIAFIAACLFLYAAGDCPNDTNTAESHGQNRASDPAHAAWPPKGMILGRDEPHSGARQTLFVVTPTFARLSQKLDLTRLSHTLFVAATRHRIHWIVIEDAHERSALVAGVLARSGLVYTHLNKKEQHLAERPRAA
jgi:hypothetical protein